MRFLQNSLAASLILISGCGSMGGRSAVENISSNSLNAASYRSVKIDVQSSLPDSKDALDLVKLAFEHRLHPMPAKSNGKDLLVVVELVEISEPSALSRFMVGAGAGADQIVARVSALESGISLTTFKVRAEQNNGIHGALTTAAAKIATDTLDRLGLPSEKISDK